MGRRTADTAAARTARPQRARNQSSPRSASRTRPPHRANRRTHAGARRLACASAGRCLTAGARVSFDDAREALRRNSYRGRRRRATHLAVAGEVMGFGLWALGWFHDDNRFVLAATDWIHSLDAAHTTRSAVSGFGRRA